MRSRPGRDTGEPRPRPTAQTRLHVRAQLWVLQAPLGPPLVVNLDGRTVLAGWGDSVAVCLSLWFVGHLHDLRERLDGREPQLGGLSVAVELLAAPGEDWID